MEKNIKIIGHIQGKHTSIFFNNSTQLVSESFKMIIKDIQNNKIIETGYNFNDFPFEAWDAMTGKKSAIRPTFEFDILETETISNYTQQAFRRYTINGLKEIAPLQAGVDNGVVATPEPKLGMFGPAPAATSTPEAAPAAAPAATPDFDKIDF